MTSSSMFREDLKGLMVSCKGHQMTIVYFFRIACLFLGMLDEAPAWLPIFELY